MFGNLRILAFFTVWCAQPALVVRTAKASALTHLRAQGLPIRDTVLVCLNAVCRLPLLPGLLLPLPLPLQQPLLLGATTGLCTEASQYS